MHSTLRTLATIFLLSFIWNFVFPGVVAYKDGVFYAQDIKDHLPAHSVTQLARLRAFEKKRDQYVSLISEIEIKLQQLLNKGAPYNNLEPLLNLQQHYKDELAATKQPITISACYESRTGYYFFAAYVFLAIHVFLLMPRASRPISKSKLIRDALLAYLGFIFTNWLRNFVFFDEGRTIFSFVNYDISPASFYLQELRAIGMCLLFSAIWQQWLAIREDVSQRVQTWPTETRSLVEINETASYVSDLFSRWQVDSICIVGAFLPWSLFYWINSMTLGDTRYYISAIVIHLFWAMSWISVSAPLLLALQHWSRLKAKSLAMLCEQSGDATEVERRIGMINQINPVSSLQFVGASIVTATSFLLPLVQLIR